MIHYFSETGYLKQILPSFEHRKEQLTIAEFLMESLYNQETAFIEAGTGIGKTIAYLVPALIYALDNEKKIALSTETKTLQQQIISKDLPLVSSLLKQYGNYDFKYSLCLGSANYPCFKRYTHALARGVFYKKEMQAVENIEKLFLSKSVFTVFDAGAPRRVWSEISRESEICDGFKCQYFSRCIYAKARREWNESTLLVMNHYLYFSNLAAGKTFLPQTDIVIFDEAHSLEDIISQQMRYTLSDKIFRVVIEPLHQGNRHNILSAIKDTNITTGLRDSIPALMEKTEKYFNRLEESITGTAGYVRVKEPLHIGEELIEMLKSLLTLLGGIDESSIEETHRIDLEIVRGKLFILTEQLNTFVYQILEDYVYWIERESEALLGKVSAKCQPIEVAGTVASDFESHDSCFFISATLTIDSDFSYISGKLGVQSYRSISLDSSFDYPSQLILYIDRELGEPDGGKYTERSAETAATLISLLNGNCLMLFTSYRMLNDVKSALRERTEHVIYSQDELTSSDAIAEFIRNQNSVLMGTHSYWQGIDLPGDLLRGVVIMRLPFSVPDSPPMQAKIEAITLRGGNPFYALQVPEAILKFKQGFGRLIRSKTDIGIVAILDSRILRKGYGKLFLKSIPSCKIVYTIDEVKREYGRLIEQGEG
jgi:ATP-dependent DNA helicase DinG